MAPASTPPATPPKPKPVLATPEDPLAWTRSLPPNESVTGPVRVYCDGIYDLFHFGHMRSLKQARDLFPNAQVALVVGVCGDEVTRANKGRTVLLEHERAEGLKHCKWVDEVVENAPWLVTEEFVKQHKIDFIVHGDDNNGVYLDKDGNDVYGWAKEKGYFRLVKRTEGISTSDIITRILKEYDEYVRRNLKRGVDRRELGVSLAREAILNAQEKMHEIREDAEATWKKVVGGVGKWGEDIQRFARKFQLSNNDDTDDESATESPPKRRKISAVRK